MKIVFRYLWVHALVMAMAFTSGAAAAENKPDPGAAEPAGQETVQPLPFGEQTAGGMEAAETLPASKKGAGEKRYGIDHEKPAPELKIRMKEFESRKNKTTIVVKSEPEDGIVALTWRVQGMTSKPGDTPIKFTLYYGEESGEYDRKLELGTVYEYKLRNLKNHQNYYIIVKGTYRREAEEDAADPLRAKPQTETVVYSKEIMATPRPAEEAGSSLEKAFAEKTFTRQESKEAEVFKRDLKQFGYDFFKNTLAAPSEYVPVGADYVIGPGDSLQISLWGTIQGRYELSVDRNGEIFIPKVGAVKLWGLGFQQARETINKAISRIFKGYELNVTLGSLRSIQVFVVGAVTEPGTYSISSVATVINALSLAGGPTKDGSLRAVRLSRGGKVVEEIDLYDMLLAGDRHKDIRLESGDTIFVPVVGPVVAIAGEVKRPAIYETKGRMSLLDALRMAGGMTAAGDSARIQLERIENGERVVRDIESAGGKLEETLAAVEVHDRDMVKVFPVQKAFRQVVSLQGNVVKPGEFQYRRGMHVSDAVPSYEALLPDTYLDAGEIVRLVPPDLHKETVAFNLNKVFQGDARENLELREQDTIRIFSRWDMVEKPSVSVNGLVLKPGTYDFYPKMTVRDLVVAAGSLKRNAYLENAELTRVVVSDGKAHATRVNIDLDKALIGDPGHNLELKPDDVLIVRGIVEWLESTDRFVTLKGEVRFPGTYSINKGERLDSVIRRAGGFTDKAFLPGAKFTRRSVQKDQQKRMDEIIARTEQDILKKQGELSSLAASREELEATKSSLEGLMKSLDKMKTLKAEGRVVIRLSALDEMVKGPYDLELLGGDLLEVPPAPGVVNIMGQVYNPTAFIFMTGRNVEFYLKKAGGPTHDGEEDEMYVIKADGTVVSRQQSSSGIRWDEDARRWVFGGFMSASLDQGDTLVVPQKIERIAWLREIKDITTIMSQIALTAGTVLIGLR
jgi:protein involved in polysaccharide export with SLBB domain